MSYIVGLRKANLIPVTSLESTMQHANAIFSNTCVEVQGVFAKCEPYSDIDVIYELGDVCDAVYTGEDIIAAKLERAEHDQS